MLVFSLDISTFDLVVFSCGDRLVRNSGEAGHKPCFFLCNAVFLNITGRNGKISMDLDRLVAYFRDGKSNDEYTRSLENSVQMIRNDPAKEAEYITMLCKLDEERAAGLEEGQAKERIRSAKSFVKTALLNNCSEDMILNMLSSMYDWSIEEAKEFYQKSKLDVD